jgi:hypothetical protein
MTLNEMKLGRPSPSALFPPTIEGFLAVDGGLIISANSLKTWWPGTELNRRRQPFQGCALPPELPGHIRYPALGRGYEGLFTSRRLCGSANRASYPMRKRAERFDYSNDNWFPQCRVCGDTTKRQRPYIGKVLSAVWSSREALHEFHQAAQRNPRWAFGDPGLLVFHPGCAGDIEVNPGSIFCEFL